MSSRTKLIALAVVAVMLPTMVLSLIQYNSLLELQSKTKQAAQESLRQVLYGVAGRAEVELAWMAEEALGTLDAESLSRENVLDIERRFESVRTSNPAIDRLFLSFECGCEAFGVVTSANGSRRFVNERAAKRLEVLQVQDLFERAREDAYPDGRMGRDFLFAHLSDCSGPSCRKGNDFETYVFYPLIDQGGEELGFAAMSVKPDYITDELFARVLPSKLDRELAIGIFDENDSELFSTQTSRQTWEVALPLAPVFPKWSVGAGFRNTTIEGAAQEQFRESLALSLFVLSLLILGIILTLRATAREIRLAEAKSTFVSNVSHELKTPLALIRLFAETLELGRVRSSDKAQEYYRIISNESRRLTQLINNILDFSRIEAGRKEYQFETTDVAQVVREVVETYQYPLENAGFKIVTDIETDLADVRIDRDAMSQAVLNLVNNAVKYSDEVKKIDIRVHATEGHIAVEVADKGIGIQTSEQEKIFEKFYRISTGLVHDRKGSGLGLALVEHIVKAHRGEIVVESALGKGSRFTVLIPLAANG